MSSPYTTSELEQHNIELSRPQRKCIITGEIADKAVLIRFVASPDGELVADTGNKLGGRGVWVSAVRETIDQAISGNQFSRHLKQPVQISDNFLDNLDHRLADQLIARLTMMRKVGVLVAGGGKLRGQAHLSGLLIGDDASPSETQKLIRSCRPDWMEKGVPSVWLGQVSGSTSVAYAGVFRTASSVEWQLETQFRTELQRWRGVAKANDKR